MDSDRPGHQRREKNRRRVSTDFKFDTLGLHLSQPALKFDEYHSSPWFGQKKASPVDSDFKHWTIVSEGFPPGTTVDELKKYGRRKQLEHLKPRDNLRLEESTDVPTYKSEYKRRFQPFALSDFQLDKSSGNKENSLVKDSNRPLPEIKLSYIDHPRKRQQNHLEPLPGDPAMEPPAVQPGPRPSLPAKCDKRRHLRRSTALKPEGQMVCETEARKEYKAYANPERAQMIRRLPTLKPEGKFESLITEQQDKFIAFLLSKRPILEKKKTLLKMEGDFDFLTENNVRYVPHGLPERPRIRKRSTSLKLDGELEFFPEYRESFVDFHRTRPITYKPNGTLRYDEGDLAQGDTETRTQFVNFDNVQVPASAKPENNLLMEGDMEIVPEYKTNYVDFPRERPFTRKPLNQIRPEGNFQVVTESSERFSEFPSQGKTESLKRPNNLKLEGTVDFTSEQTDKYKRHEAPEKSEPVKTTPNLKLEGDMNFTTEKADKYGNLIPEVEIGPPRRPSSLKCEKDFLFSPDYQKCLHNYRNSENMLKPGRTFRSNPTSPRKIPKERVKFGLFDTENVALSGTPSKRLSPRRLNETSRSPEKTLKFDLPHKEVPTIRRMDADDDDHYAFRDKPKPEILVKPPADDFQAFHVLDVKGQRGCATMSGDIVGGEKSTSDDDSTYRLEVSNPNQPSPAKRDWKVYPTPAMTAELMEEAEKRARKRAESYEKVVKSPEIANFLLGDCNNNSSSNGNSSGSDSNGNCCKAPEKLSPLFPVETTTTKPAFVVLDGSKRPGRAPKEKRTWNPPEWMRSSPLL